MNVLSIGTKIKLNDGTIKGYIDGIIIKNIPPSVEYKIVYYNNGEIVTDYLAEYEFTFDKSDRLRIGFNNDI